MIKNRYFITYGLLIAGLLSFWGCGKATNVVAPSTSTITVTALPGTTLSTGSQFTIKAVVMDGTEYKNGMGVVFRSSNSAVASFSSTGAVNQTSADTNNSGVATITVYALSAGTADISADISTDSGTVSLTVN